MIKFTLLLYIVHTTTMEINDIKIQEFDAILQMKYKIVMEEKDRSKRKTNGWASFGKGLMKSAFKVGLGIVAPPVYGAVVIAEIGYDISKKDYVSATMNAGFGVLDAVSLGAASAVGKEAGKQVYKEAAKGVFTIGPKGGLKVLVKGMPKYVSRMSKKAVTKAVTQNASLAATIATSTVIAAESAKVGARMVVEEMAKDYISTENKNKIDETGLNSEDIETIIDIMKVPRWKAVMALRLTEGNLRMAMKILSD